MALVMIICPRTGDGVSTDTDAATFERLSDASAQMQCPRCGEVHVWRKADATLVEAQGDRAHKA